jgi:small-conductance mechanosensitive channel
MCGLFYLTFSTAEMLRAALTIAGILAIAVAVGLIVHFVIFAILPKAARRTRWAMDDALIDRLRKPSMLLLPTLAMQIAMRDIEDLPAFVPHIVALLTYASVIWMVIAIIGWFEHVIKSRHDVTVADNLEARRVHTQISVIARSLMVVVLVVGIGAALMTFEQVRMLGTAVLASAGIAGLIVGLAARPVLENLFAGLQIALTQPIRIDDVVIIDGEWGRIEEVTLTYIVVRIWDQRRLIVPFSKIISESFQNWTRISADILGTVFLHTDYTVPVERVREELKRICESCDKWDGKVCALQVTEARERTMELRALVSAKDSPTAWDLRVYVREKLIDFMQREFPDALPRTRIEMSQREGKLA